jgi:hypothetical protein
MDLDAKQEEINKEFKDSPVKTTEELIEFTFGLSFKFAQQMKENNPNSYNNFAKVLAVGFITLRDLQRELPEDSDDPVHEIAKAFPVRLVKGLQEAGIIRK